MRRNERGSVLVVVVGVLSVLVLMATAFISVMQMSKTTGTNQAVAMHARMAARAGLAYAVSMVNMAYTDSTGTVSYNTSNPHQGWSEFFGVGYLYAPSPYPTVPAGSESAVKVTSFRKHGVVGGTCYWKWDLTHASGVDFTGDGGATQSGDDTYRIRYAVVIQNLNALIYTAGFSHAKDAAKVKAIALKNTLDAVTSTSNPQASIDDLLSVDGGPFSYIHAEGLAPTASAAALRCITPWQGVDGASRPYGTINVNTTYPGMMQSVINNMYNVHSAAGEGTFGVTDVTMLAGSGGTSCQTLVKAVLDDVVANVNAQLGAAPYFATNNVFNLRTSCSTTLGNLFQMIHDHRAAAYTSIPSATIAPFWTLTDSSKETEAALMEDYANQMFTTFFSPPGGGAFAFDFDLSGTYPTSASWIAESDHSTLPALATIDGGGICSDTSIRTPHFDVTGSCFYVVVKGQVVKSDDPTVVLGSRTIEACYDASTQTIIYQRFASK